MKLMINIWWLAILVTSGGWFFESRLRTELQVSLEHAKEERVQISRELAVIIKDRNEERKERLKLIQDFGALEKDIALCAKKQK